MLAGQMVAQGTPLPDYVQREFEDYLKWGVSNLVDILRAKTGLSKLSA